MKNIHNLMLKAESSPFKRRILQFVLSYAIPFNRPHGFKIKEVFTDGFHIVLPYWKINRNHIKGIHACGLATLSEFVSGFFQQKYPCEEVQAERKQNFPSAHKFVPRLLAVILGK